MERSFTWKLLLVSFLAGTVVLCLFAFSKKLYASDKVVGYKKKMEVKTEFPWERMAHQFAGAVMFK